jgi:hypothetical protein
MPEGTPLRWLAPFGAALSLVACYVTLVAARARFSSSGIGPSEWRGAGACNEMFVLV